MVDAVLLKKRLDDIEKLAQGSPLKRFFCRPLTYFFGVFHNRIWYPLSKQEVLVDCNTFFNSKLSVNLPAGLDIFLLSAKTHSSEIRLAKYMINTLTDVNVFWDIGAHFGFFTQLASTLMPQQSTILSVEAASNTYRILTLNTAKYANVVVENMAISDTNGTMVFYEFPAKYSEYNTLLPDQFSEDEWYKKTKVKKNTIKSISLDQLAKEKHIIPQVIKMDLEGAEWMAIKGAQNLLREHAPIIIMEYSLLADKNEHHKKAFDMLLSHGYKVFVIDDSGELKITTSDALLRRENSDQSDNIVFKK
ncbi:MAG: FkbM family methyltransferase [Saprospiraceae bacterium]|nr:FkbM family methyltransferase [Saprospiraceae bacterium]